MNKRQKEMLQELLDSKNNKIKHLQSVINKAIEYITSYDFEYLHEQMEHTLVDVLEVLLEILRSKDE